MDAGGDKSIDVNGTIVGLGYGPTHDTSPVNLTISLKRGDYIQIKGKQAAHSTTNFFWINKV